MENQIPGLEIISILVMRNSQVINWYIGFLILVK
jgi:hypothetical protein